MLCTSEPTLDDRDLLRKLWKSIRVDDEVQVHCGEAGPTDTDLFRAEVPAEAAAGVAAMPALGRLGTAEDVARVVAVLARREGRWMTGQIVAADGGLV